MKGIYRVLIAFFCLFLALACYAFGVPGGGAVFLVLGVLLEGLFWFGILGVRKRNGS